MRSFHPVKAVGFISLAAALSKALVTRYDTLASKDCWDIVDFLGVGSWVFSRPGKTPDSQLVKCVIEI